MKGCNVCFKAPSPRCRALLDFSSAESEGRGRCADIFQIEVKRWRRWLLPECWQAESGRQNQPLRNTAGGLQPSKDLASCGGCSSAEEQKVKKQLKQNWRKSAVCIEPC